MRKYGFLVSLFVVFALILSACGADTGVEDNANDDFGANANGEFNTNGDLGGDLNANDNFNGGLNANDNFNGNLNANDNLNGNLNANDNLNGNLNANDNTNANDNANANANMNANDNGAVTTPAVGATPGALVTPLATQPVGSEGQLPVTGAVDPSLVSNLLDFEVYSQDGEQIGEVEQVILDFSNERVAYIVVGLGGFLGLGERDVAVPFQAFQIRSTAGAGSPDNAVVLMVDSASLESAPEFDSAAFAGPGLMTEGWDADLQPYWTGLGFTGEASPQAPATTVEPGAMATAVVTATMVTPGTTITGTTGTTITGTAGMRGFVLASDFLGQDIYTGAGEQLATIEDVIIDTQSGRVMYILVDLGGATADRLVPVPVPAFSWDSANEYFISVIDRTTLEAAPFFENNLFPNWTDPTWDTDFQFYWDPILPTTRS